MPFALPFLSFDLILPSVIAANQKQALRQTAQEISKIIGIGERILSDRLIDQEKQRSSAIGQGTAVGHLHISSLTQPFSALIRLRDPVDFPGGPDSLPVDLICLLMTPEREGAAYLRTMSRISRLLRDEAICRKLRAAEDDKAIRKIIEQSSALMMAA